MLISIETTPNPNSMKLNLNESLALVGTFRLENQAEAPVLVRKLLTISGVQSVFVSDDFLTLNRDPRADWQSVLNAAQEMVSEGFDGDVKPVGLEQNQLQGDSLGEIRVLVQTFRDIPIQVKVTDGNSEQRVGLPAYFGTAARELQGHFGADYLKERHWVDWGARYGTLAEIAQEVSDEIEGLLDEPMIERQKTLALENISQASHSQALVMDKQAYLEITDWHQRLRFIQALDAVEDHLPLLIVALKDEQPQIRRWTAAKLASVKTGESVKALCESLLNDSNVGVRRTAGDSLSDIGDAAAEQAVCQALKDSNKLVRWRAARFLTELGTEFALPFLEAARQEQEYEVRLEVEAAMNRIREGTAAPLPVWKQMSQN